MVVDRVLTFDPTQNRFSMLDTTDGAKQFNGLGFPLNNNHAQERRNILGQCIRIPLAQHVP